MFVGFELSHAGVQNLYDRQVAERVKEPTVVGVSIASVFEVVQLWVCSQSISIEAESRQAFHALVTVRFLSC